MARCTVACVTHYTSNSMNAAAALQAHGIGCLAPGAHTARLHRALRKHLRRARPFCLKTCSGQPARNSTIIVFRSTSAKKWKPSACVQHELHAWHMTTGSCANMADLLNFMSTTRLLLMLPMTTQALGKVEAHFCSRTKVFAVLPPLAFEVRRTKGQSHCKRAALLNA